MGVNITVEFKSGNTVLETRSFQGEYTDWWKRASTFGHPGTSRPFGLDKIFNLANTQLTINTAGNHYAQGSFSGTPSQIFPGKYGLIPYSVASPTGEIITAPPLGSNPLYASTPNSGVHINISTQDINNLQQIRSGQNNNGLRTNVFLFQSGGYYYLCFLNTNQSGYYKRLGTRDPEELNETLSRYFGYGDGSYLSCNPRGDGWTPFSTRYYIINPTAYTYPISEIMGIACIDNPYSASSVIFYDPVTYSDVGSFSIYMQGYVNLQYLVDYNYFGNWFAANASGICYIVKNYPQFVIPNRDELNLYIGDKLYRQTNVYIGDMFRFNGNRINTLNVDTQYSFPFGVIGCLGQPTFIDIGEGFYLGRTFFSPFIDASNQPVYWNDDWSVVGIADRGSISNYVAQCDMSYYENPPAGTDTIVTNVTLD